MKRGTVALLSLALVGCATPETDPVSPTDPPPPAFTETEAIDAQEAGVPNAPTVVAVSSCLNSMR